MGTKGSWQRPFTVDKEIRDLRHNLAFGKITDKEYDVKVRDLYESRAQKEQTA